MSIHTCESHGDVVVVFTPSRYSVKCPFCQLEDDYNDLQEKTESLESRIDDLESEQETAR